MRFAPRATTLVLVSRRMDRLEHLRSELLVRHPRLKVVALEADLAQEHEVENLLGRFADQAGSVDVVVNNAGSGEAVLFDRSVWARARQVLQTNIMAVARLTSALVPAMVRQGPEAGLRRESSACLSLRRADARWPSSLHLRSAASSCRSAGPARTAMRRAPSMETRK